MSGEGLCREGTGPVPAPGGRRVPGPDGPDHVPGPGVVAGFRGVLARIGGPAEDPAGEALSEAGCIDLIRELEDLKAAAAGAQAVLTAHLAAARSQAEAAAGVPAKRRGAGLASEVALARRVSPHRGGQHLGLATALVSDMPHTLAALRAGWLSEWRATLVVRESICLTRAHRQALDAALCADPATTRGWGDRRLVAEAKRAAYRLDPHHVVQRTARAEADRHVSIRPAPDTMAYLSALLPIPQAVAIHAALTAAATTARNAGDPRTRGQVMADTLVAQITGRAPTAGTPVAVQLVMTDHALLAGGNEPAHLPGHGTVPAAWARDLITTALTTGAGAWLRRLFTDEADHVVAMESRSRTAPPALADLIRARDGGTCRTPWCDAPIRHIDHIDPHARGGPTTNANLQGLCERCNYTKQAPRWQAHPTQPGDLAHEVETITPTGHTYLSRAPAQPHGPRPPARDRPDLARSTLERLLADHLHAA